MTHFTPWYALAGGAIIGLAASLLLLSHGRIAGISGILGGLLQAQTHDRGYRISFLVGLLASGVILALWLPQTVAGEPRLPVSWVVLAGGLVGYGTRLGNGCTSGHGVCGVSRLSPRSLAATATFMITGALTVFVVRHLLGGAR